MIFSRLFVITTYAFFAMCNFVFALDDRSVISAIQQAAVGDAQSVTGPVYFNIELDTFQAGGEETTVKITADRVTAARPKNRWIGELVYLVPANGAYLITLSFVKDSTGDGTNNDISLRLKKQSPGGENRDTILSVENGYSGQSRKSASGSTIHRLKRNDAISISSIDGSNGKRIMKDIRLTILKIE